MTGCSQSGPIGPPAAFPGRIGSHSHPRPTPRRARGCWGSGRHSLRRRHPPERRCRTGAGRTPRIGWCWGPGRIPPHRSRRIEGRPQSSTGPAGRSTPHWPEGCRRMGRTANRHRRCKRSDSRTDPRSTAVGWRRWCSIGSTPPNRIRWPTINRDRDQRGTRRS